jgi:hypothetical protein
VGGCIKLRAMTNWATISTLAAAGSTLVLAGVTFASVRSANRSARTADRAARTAEQSLLAGQRPLLMNSRLQDPVQKVQFMEGTPAHVGGGRAALSSTDTVVYMAVSIRNVGTGLGVLHGWHVCPAVQTERSHPPLEDFTAQTRDIYVASGDNGFWQGAYRDPQTESFKGAAAAIDAGDPLTLSLLYGDYEGGQRVISQFTLRHGEDDTWLASVVRHFNIDRPDPR